MYCASSWYGICENIATIWWACILVLISSYSPHLHLSFLHVTNDGLLMCTHIHYHLILMYSTWIYVKITSRICSPIGWCSPRTHLILVLRLITYNYELRTSHYSSLSALTMEALTIGAVVCSCACINRLAARCCDWLTCWVVEFLDLLSDSCTSFYESIIFSLI